MNVLRRRAPNSVPSLFAPIAALCVAAACGCTSRPPAEAAALPRPSATLSAGPARLLDQNRAVLRLEARIRNPRADALSLEAADCAVAVDGAAAPLAAVLAAPPPGLRGSTLAALSETVLAFDCRIDLRSLDAAVRGPEGPAEAAWSAAARFVLRAADGSVLEIVAAAGGTVPIVREPILRITSLRVERDVLVTTNLRLGLEVRNPNAFPLEIRSVSFDFSGEGKLWASGDESEAATIPAKGRIERGLRFTMNFADVDRRLFDLVAKLRVIRYGLAGSASVATALEAIPSFTLGFDLEGSCPVEE
jgi:hypothetical protein